MPRMDGTLKILLKFLDADINLSELYTKNQGSVFR